MCDLNQRGLERRVGETHRDAEVEDFAGDDEVVQAVHHLLDARLPVVPVHVEDVDVVCAQLLERRFDRVVQGLHVVADE